MIKEVIIEGEITDYAGGPPPQNGLKIDGKHLSNIIERVFGSRDMRQEGKFVGAYHGKFRITIEKLEESEQS